MAAKRHPKYVDDVIDAVFQRLISEVPAARSEQQLVALKVTTEMRSAFVRFEAEVRAEWIAKLAPAFNCAEAVGEWTAHMQQAINGVGFCDEGLACEYVIRREKAINDYMLARKAVIEAVKALATPTG